MRIVVTGATGNIGTSLLAALAGDERVDSILGLARRIPKLRVPRTEWVAADVSSSALERHFEGADAVVHLAWMIQPARDQALLERVNVEGSRRVFEAARSAGAGALVHASSVGAYSPGPKDRAVDESWPTGGIPATTTRARSPRASGCSMSSSPTRRRCAWPVSGRRSCSSATPPRRSDASSSASWCARRSCGAG